MKKSMLLAAVAALAVFAAGCGQAVPASSTAASSTAPSSAPVSSAAPVKEPENTNLLTGLPTLTKEAYGKRPAAVMVNNIEDSLPQYGIAQADVLFELPVEYDITRLMAMYGDYTQVPKVCSVRSCRYYYPILAVGFDAFYVHWGQDPSMAQRTLDALNIDRMNGIDNTYGLYGRDQSRLDSGMSLEHTGYFDGPAMAQALADNGVRTDLKSEKAGIAAFAFQKDAAPVKPEGKACTKLQVDFGTATRGYYSTFFYDEGTNTYLKQHNGSPHMDVGTDTQLAFTNVLVLETEIAVANDPDFHKIINWSGGKGTHKGYYLSDGAVQELTWEKTGEYDPLKLYDKSGAELKLNRGKSYIAVTHPDHVTLS